ncbi:hypothetical protein ACQ4LE_000103, partial [Meloidogyne hapla]
MNKTFGLNSFQQIYDLVMDKNNKWCKEGDKIESESQKDNKKDDLKEVEENELNLSGSDKKVKENNSYSGNKNKRIKKQQKKKQNRNKKKMTSSNENAVENINQNLNSNEESLENNKNCQSLNNEIIENLNMEEKVNDDNNENNEDDEGWVLNKKDEMKKRREEQKRREEEEKLKRINKSKEKDEIDTKSLDSLNNNSKMDYNKYYINEMKRKNVLNNENIIEKKKEIIDDSEKTGKLDEIKDKELVKSPKISFKAILVKKDLRNEVIEDSKESIIKGKEIKESADMDLKNKKEDERKVGENEEFKNVKKEDKILVQSEQFSDKINRSSIDPFNPIKYLEEDALADRYKKFISANGDPRKIFQALDIGVVVNELNKRFKHFEKISKTNICKNNIDNLLIGEVQVKINKQNDGDCPLLIKRIENEFNKIIEDSNSIINSLEKFEILENKLHILLKELVIIMDGWKLL